MPSLSSLKQDNKQRPCTRLSLSRITRRRRRRHPRHRRRTNRSLPKSDWSRRSSSFDRKELTEKKQKQETKNRNRKYSMKNKYRMSSLIGALIVLTIPAARATPPATLPI